MFDILKKKLSKVVGSFVSKKTEETEREEDKIGGIDSIAEDRESGIGKQEDELVGAVANKKEPIEKGVGSEELKVSDNEKDDKKKELIKLSIKTKIRGALLRNIKISQSEMDELIDALTISMLQSDVGFDTTEKFTSSLMKRLAETKFDYNGMKNQMREDIRASLFDILGKTNDRIDILEYVKKKISVENPVRILFLGPNGTGKTTTIAKIAYMLKKNKISSVMSASDTFRAAAIEQTEYHAKKIGVAVVKGNYGSDPASIAYDTIGYAKSHYINVVLIDTAGRQETNKNLMIEVQKIVRVSKPDLILFVGESTSGNIIAMQISEFNKFIKIDGIILTKLDCDAKGGSVISITDVTGIPILMFGTGEDYDAIIKFNPKFIVDSILP